MSVNRMTLQNPAKAQKLASGKAKCYLRQRNRSQDFKKIYWGQKAGFFSWTYEAIQATPFWLGPPKHSPFLTAKLFWLRAILPSKPVHPRTPKHPGSYEKDGSQQGSQRGRQMLAGLAQMTDGHYMICRANSEAKPFTLHFLYAFYQKLRLNLLLAVPGTKGNACFPSGWWEEGSGTLESTASTSELQTRNTTW